MMVKVKPQIVVIDDNIFRGDYPLIDRLDIVYGAENVHIFQETSTGLAFIQQNLTRKMIVLLDIMFGNRPQGFEVFEKVMKKSSLVCFIIMTGNMEKIDRKSLVQLINKQAWYFIQRDRPAKEIMKMVQDAELHLATRVDSALEEWILWHSPQDQNKPYLKTRSGKTYTLFDILKSLRMGDALGTEMAEGILKLTIDLLARNKEFINDKTA